ncbi:hypothetical protein AK812_SmicGene48762, partial [Symbiodinium microadriaticum]
MKCGCHMKRQSLESGAVSLLSPCGALGHPRSAFLWA